MKSKINKFGFTLAEVAIAVGMASALLILVLQMSSSVRNDVAKGTVDLQNLQSARTVINYLRRDFTCAIPYYSQNESVEIKDEVRTDPMVYVPGAYDYKHQTRPIVVRQFDISFSKKEFDSSGNVVTKNIQYVFDQHSQTLVRGDGSGNNKVFKDIKYIDFNLYYHPLNDSVPMLLVTMKVETKEANKTNVLDLKTTICSNITNRDIVNLDWNNVSN